MQGPELVNALTDLEYQREAGNRFRRRVSAEGDAAESDAVIDVLVAATRTRVRQNQRFGDHLVTTEVPGLAFALRRDPVIMTVELRRLSGELQTVELLIPDEVSALVLKSSATIVREKTTDFSDIWRCLEICFAAGLVPNAFGGHRDSEAAAARVRRLFAEPGALGMRMLVEDQKLSEVAAGQRFARVSALVARVLG